MSDLNLCPVTVDLCFSRGDNPSFAFNLQNPNGTPIDITGFNYILTVDPSPAPPDNTNNLFFLVGAVTAPTQGEVTFQATNVQMDQPPGTYFYDVQETNDVAAVRTVIKGQFVIQQDITKA